jgi:hypothetical protein
MRYLYTFAIENTEESFAKQNCLFLFYIEQLRLSIIMGQVLKNIPDGAAIFSMTKNRLQA